MRRGARPADLTHPSLGSKADLWVRNVQLSLWSLIPALIPVVIGLVRDGMGIQDMFANFGIWAWLTVLTQVFGGLVTALVIKVRCSSLGSL
jgi:UDP-sugar transporter A1/2/3